MNRLIGSLSPEARAILETLDVYFDEQIPGLNVDALGLPPDDTSKLREAIDRLLRKEKAPPELSGLLGVTDEEIDFKDLENQEEEDS